MSSDHEGSSGTSKYQHLSDSMYYSRYLKPVALQKEGKLKTDWKFPHKDIQKNKQAGLKRGWQRMPLCLLLDA